jgi:hypothetical protein
VTPSSLCGIRQRTGSWWLSAGSLLDPRSLGSFDAIVAALSEDGSRLIFRQAERSRQKSHRVLRKFRHFSVIEAFLLSTVI